MHEYIKPIFENSVPINDAWCFCIAVPTSFENHQFHACKESFIKRVWDQDGCFHDFFFLTYGEEHKANFKHNLLIVNKFLKLKGPTFKENDRKLYLVSRFWRSNPILTDLLACIFKCSRSTKVESLDDFLEKPYFTSELVYSLLKKARKIKEIFPEDNLTLRSNLFNYSEGNNGLISFCSHLSQNVKEKIRA